MIPDLTLFGTIRRNQRELKIEDDIKSCGKDRRRREKAAGRGAAELGVLGKRGCPCEEGWAEVMEVEEHSLLQGLHPHFLVMQLLLHLGQLLLQSGELWTQGRAAGYHGAQWASLTTTCQKRLVMTVQECLATVTPGHNKHLYGVADGA